MNRPVIGITTTVIAGKDGLRENEKFGANRMYIDCLVAAGAAPVLITKETPPDSVPNIVDGLLIPGGDDIDGKYFGQDNHPKISLEDPERYPSEVALLDILPLEVPILGICYGSQMLNVYRGGDIIQHIPDRLPDSKHSGGTMQTYIVERDCRLAEIFGAIEVKGKSYHHQSNDKPGGGLRVVARTEDGIVEAFEDVSDRWLFGIQWHPERTPDDPATVRLFRSFVEQSAKYRAARGR